MARFFDIIIDSRTTSKTYRETNGEFIAVVAGTAAGRFAITPNGDRAHHYDAPSQVPELVRKYKAKGLTVKVM